MTDSVDGETDNVGGRMELRINRNLRGGLLVNRPRVSVLIALVSLIPAACEASPGPRGVTGVVVNAVDGKPVPRATVAVGGRKTISRRDGTFYLSDVAEKASATATHCGYFEGTRAAVSDDPTIALTPAPIDIQVSSRETGAGIRAIVRFGNGKTQTGRDGSLVLEGIPICAHRATVEARGYEDETVSIGDDRAITVELQPKRMVK